MNWEIDGYEDIPRKPEPLFLSIQALSSCHSVLVTAALVVIMMCTFRVCMCVLYFKDFEHLLHLKMQVYNLASNFPSLIIFLQFFKFLPLENFNPSFILKVTYRKKKFCFYHVTNYILIIYTTKQI